MFKVFMMLVAVLLMVESQICFAGCEKDTDCKGDRICVNGKCSAPTSSSKYDVKKNVTATASGYKKLSINLTYSPDKFFVGGYVGDCSFSINLDGDDLANYNYQVNGRVNDPKDFEYTIGTYDVSVGSHNLFAKLSCSNMKEKEIKSVQSIYNDTELNFTHNENCTLGCSTSLKLSTSVQK